MRKFFAAFAFTIVASVAAFGQAFEVASIRPAAPLNIAALQAGKATVGQKVEGSRVTLGFVSLRDLITIAYEIKPDQFVGPDWMAMQRYDISATMPEGATDKQIPAMLKALLTERFNVKVHRETKEQNVYALTEAKGGHKMKPAAPAAPAPVADPTAEPAPPAKGETVIGTGDQQIRFTQNPNRAAAASGGTLATMNSAATGNVKISMVGGPTDGIMKLDMERMTIPTLIQQLTPMLDLPIVDQTGLTGAYQVTLQLSLADLMQTVAKAAAVTGIPMPALPPPPGAAAGGAAEPAGQSIFASVQQLGLKLDKQKADVEKLIVDSADKAPTEN
jgi:uncharacterized protein (TIGR03435 family)